MNNQNMTLKNVLTGLGSLAGLYYAFSKKKSGWGYVGFFIVGGIAGSIVGSTIEYVMKPKDPTLQKPTKPKAPIQPVPTMTVTEVPTKL
jgi:hypothetical protein